MLRTLILVVIFLFCNSGLVFSQIKFDYEYLQKIKERSRSGDEQIVKAMKVLVSAADSVRKIRNLPKVTEKKHTPVTSDVHDYVSMATYYWPNPSTSNGLPYVPIDGKANPEVGEIDNYRNLVNLATRIKVLSLAYFFTEDDKYVTSAMPLINVFFLRRDTRMNPNFNHAQFVKGINDGRIEGIVEARFFIDVLEGVELMKENAAFERKYYAGLQSWFRDFFDWMENSEQGQKGKNLKNNIETVYHLQRLVYAKFLKDERKFRSIVSNDLPALIKRQIRSDGKQSLELRRAKPTNYSISNLNYWIEIEAVLRNSNQTLVSRNKETSQRFEKALSVIDRMAIKGLDDRHKRQYNVITSRVKSDYRNSDLNVNSSSKVNTLEEALYILTSF